MRTRPQFKPLKWYSRAVVLGACLAALSTPAYGQTASTASDDAGSVSLFDGRSLAGWQGSDRQPPSGWVAEEGVLHFTSPKPRNVSRDIFTEKEYTNFIFEAEWKIPARGNSGVKYRVAKYGKQDLGLEYQLMGESSPDGKPPANLKGCTAALYELVPVDRDHWQTKPPGEWNHMRIVLNAGKIEHWLNGKRVVQADTNSDEFERAVASSKFRGYPGFGRNKGGRIMLQDHASEVWFRNIRIKELP